MESNEGIEKLCAATRQMAHSGKIEQEYYLKQHGGDFEKVWRCRTLNMDMNSGIGFYYCYNGADRAQE